MTPRSHRTTARAALFAVLSCLLFSPVPALASKPILRTFDGCVVDGLLISASGYQFTLMHHRGVQRIIVSKYEGKRITIRGLLHPGDYFTPDAPSLKVVGPCTLMKNKRFVNAWAWGNRKVARNLHRLKRYGEALVRIDKALRLQPQNYAFYLTRGRIHLYSGNKAKARVDAQRALKLAKDETERKWCRELVHRIDPPQK